MEYSSFDEMFASIGDDFEKSKMIIVDPDAKSIEVAIKVCEEGISDPLYIGNRTHISELFEELGRSIPDSSIIDAVDDTDASKKAVRLIRDGCADFLVKGHLDTKTILKEVVNKDYGIRGKGIISHFSVFQVPHYHKLLAPVDGGMITYPDLIQKKSIIDNSVSVFRAIGYDCPKVGILACVEKVNPQMPETIDAFELKKMYDQLDIKNCIVEGPISYDCAVSKHIADSKGYTSPCAGDCDILIAPNIHTGNIMGKMLSVTCGAKMAGFLVGAACPIVVTSRGSSADEKYISIKMASIVNKLIKKIDI